jgi:hypothetical protein
MGTRLATILWLACLCTGGCVGGVQGTDSHVRVTVEGGKPFPPTLAGRWQADRDDWQFVIEPDGRISSAVISFGRVQVKPGQIATVPALNGGKGVFEPGQWVVHYAPDTGDLTIKIAMSHVHVETGQNIIDGRSTDIFVGKVAIEEGVWPVLWTAFSRYTIRTAETSSAELPTDPDKGETNALVFRKVKAAP